MVGKSRGRRVAPARGGQRGRVGSAGGRTADAPRLAGRPYHGVRGRTRRRQGSATPRRLSGRRPPGGHGVAAAAVGTTCGSGTTALTVGESDGASGVVTATGWASGDDPGGRLSLSLKFPVISRASRLLAK